MNYCDYRTATVGVVVKVEQKNLANYPLQSFCIPHFTIASTVGIARIGLHLYFEVGDR